MPSFDPVVRLIYRTATTIMLLLASAIRYKLKGLRSAQVVVYNQKYCLGFRGSVLGFASEVSHILAAHEPQMQPSHQAS